MIFQAPAAILLCGDVYHLKVPDSLYVDADPEYYVTEVDVRSCVRLNACVQLLLWWSRTHVIAQQMGSDVFPKGKGLN